MKNIVITGSSGGIGKSTALELLKYEETRLFLISRNNELLQSLLNEVENGFSSAFSNRIVLLPFDLVSGNYEVLVSEIGKYTERIEVLINNAGALVNKPFKEITSDDIIRIMDTNFKGPFTLIQRLLPFFSEGSHIINITSMGGMQGSVKFNGLSLYSASKGALNTLTECLAAEFSEHKISFNSLALGSVNTPMLTEAFPGYTSKTSSKSMAEFIAWFALNANKWINGKIIPVANSTP